MREPIYLKLSSNRVIDISDYCEIEWGIENGKYAVSAKHRETHTWDFFYFSCEEYALRFAWHFYDGPCEDATLSIRKAINYAN